MLQASFRQLLSLNITSVIDEEAARLLRALLTPGVEQSLQIPKNPILEEAPPALKPPARIDRTTAGVHVEAVERLCLQWAEEGAVKRYPYECIIGLFFPLPLIIYILFEYRRLRNHVDTLLTARLADMREREGTEEVSLSGSDAVAERYRWTRRGVGV